MSKFEIYTDKKGETRFRFRAKNGEIVFSSEGYTAKASAKRAIASIKKNVPAAVVEEVVGTAKKPAASKAAATASASASKSVAKKTTKSKTASKPKASAKGA